MTDEELNRYVHEAMGKKWSTWWREPENPNYLEHGKAWGELLSWARDESWWNDFGNKYILITKEAVDSISGETSITTTVKIDMFANPRSLAEHIVSYLEEVKDG